MKKVVVLFGGNSFEHEISISSAKSILKNIDKSRYEVIPIGIDKNNNWYFYNDDIEKLDNWTSNKIIKIDNIIEYLSNIDVVLAFRACYDMKLYKEDNYPLAKKGMFLTHLPDFTKVTHSDEIEPILISKYLKKYGERKTYTIKEILDIITSMNEDYETLFARFYDFISDLDNDFTTYMKSTVVYNQSVDKNTVDKRYILLYRTMVNDYVKVIMVYGAIYQYLIKHFLYFIEDIELQADYLEEKMK